jgi:hypothetical protein
MLSVTLRLLNDSGIRCVLLLPMLAYLSKSLKLVALKLVLMGEIQVASCFQFPSVRFTHCATLAAAELSPVSDDF